MRKKNILVLSLCIIVSINNAFSQEFPKAILRGDYPDPTIVRDGADYYMTHSPFYYQPGFLIWHSRDLFNWSPVARILPEYSGSAMAPDLVKHNGKFYLYYPATGTNWVIRADSIRGQWSKPVNLKVNGIDPGHIVGEDGKRYLFLSDGWMVQLTDDGLATVGEKKKVYDGWEFPKEWKTEGLWLESPKLTYHNGYYYLTSAEGGTAGPATSHMAVSARSRSVFGPWKNSPYNPIVHTYSDRENWWSKGHGTLVEDTDGKWWIVYHAYEKDFHSLGRQTLIEPVEWTDDGWFRTIAYRKTPQDYAAKMNLSDDFSANALGLQWAFWKEYAVRNISLKNGSLTVEAKGTSPKDGRILLITPTDRNYETRVEVTVDKNNSAGLFLYYSEKAYAGVVSDGKVFTVYKNTADSLVFPCKTGKSFFAEIHNQGNSATVSVSKDGNTWTPLVENLDVSAMNHNNFGGFYALRPSLVTYGTGKSIFRDFQYKTEKTDTRRGLSSQSPKEYPEDFKPNRNNPVIPGLHADPEILYSEKTGKYYIYPTSDGFPKWASCQFKAYSSKNLKNWKDEGVILDLAKDVSWANTNAWAPCIIEKKIGDDYKYFYYFTAEGKIGVAVADNPAGPFKDSGKPLIDKKPEGITRGSNIDPDVFCDPETGKNYLYWGNSFMAVCELNDDMVSIKPNTTAVLIPDNRYYSEGAYVFYRRSYYYFSWSLNDTRSPEYQVRYVKTKSPSQPVDASQSEIILSKAPEKGIFATGHHSVLQVPGKDEWRIVYHRFKRPDGIKMGRDAGYNREVCIDRMKFNDDGSIKKVIPTR